MDRFPHYGLGVVFTLDNLLAARLETTLRDALNALPPQVAEMLAGNKELEALLATLAAGELPGGIDDPPTAPQEGEEFDADEIYRQLGLFVVAFQHVESKLMETCWFLSEPSYDLAARDEIAKLSYGRLIKETRRRIGVFLDARGVGRPDWHERVSKVLDDCRELGYLRNALVHSTYVHMEGGGKLMGVVRSDLGRELPDRGADQEWLGPDSFRQPLRESANIAFAVGMILVQLIHWSGWSDGRPGSASDTV